MVETRDLMNEIQNMKTMITAIHLNLKQLLTQMKDSGNPALLAHIRDDYAKVIENYVIDDIREKMEVKMPTSCENREKCKAILNGFLQKNVKLIRQGKISDDIIEKKRNQLYILKKKNALKDECFQCFNEAEMLFEKQIQLLRALNIYEGPKSDPSEISKLSEEFVVNNLLEPIANIKRLQILKSLTIRERTFSELMQITGLQGGNLLFHIKKLLDNGLIIQKHEGGDYIITQKGYKILKSVINLYLDLKNSE